MLGLLRHRVLWVCFKLARLCWFKRLGIKQCRVKWAILLSFALIKLLLSLPHRWIEMCVVAWWWLFLYGTTIFAKCVHVIMILVNFATFTVLDKFWRSIGLQLLLLFFSINREQLIMQLVDVGLLLTLAWLEILFAQLVGETLLARIMKKRTNVHLITTRAVALYPLVLVRMVQSFYCGVTFPTLNTSLAIIPPQAVL